MEDIMVKVERIRSARLVVRVAKLVRCKCSGTCLQIEGCCCGASKGLRDAEAELYMAVQEL